MKIEAKEASMFIKSKIYRTPNEYWVRHSVSVSVVGASSNCRNASFRDTDCMACRNRNAGKGGHVRGEVNLEQELIAL